MTNDKLLESKAQAKARKPTFTRADAHKKKRLGEGWRKPKGIQNKMRLHKKGYRVTVKPGYGSPVTLKDTQKKGLRIVTVKNLKELAALDPKKDAALLAKVGRKSKEALIAEAQKLKITLVNLPVAAYQERTKAILSSKEQHKKAVEEKVKKRAKAEEVAKPEEKKETPEAEPSEQAEKEKKDEEKKEKDKVLTSKKGY